MKLFEYRYRDCCYEIRQGLTVAEDKQSAINNVLKIQSDDLKPWVNEISTIEEYKVVLERID
jgi:hypothetical protein